MTKKSISKITFVCTLLFACININSCKSTKIDTLENKLDEKSETLEKKAANYRKASSYIDSAEQSIDDAMNYFQKSLDKISDKKDKDLIRTRINEIIKEIKFTEIK